MSGNLIRYFLCIFCLLLVFSFSSIAESSDIIIDPDFTEIISDEEYAIEYGSSNGNSDIVIDDGETVEDDSVMYMSYTGDVVESTYTIMSDDEIRQEHVLEDHTYKAPGRTFNYILYKPSGVRVLDNLPLIVVMHGSGEVGKDIGKLKKRPPWIQLNKGTCVTNALVLMPQLPSGSWDDAASDLKSLIDYIVDIYHCDVSRISITGHSLGGSGVFYMLLKYPNYFSAAASLSPCSNFKGKLASIAHVPLKILHGEYEGSYGRYSRQIRDEIQSYGGNCTVISVAGEGHPIQHCWCDSQYGLFDWLISQNSDPITIDWDRSDRVIIPVEDYDEVFGDTDDDVSDDIEIDIELDDRNGLRDSFEYEGIYYEDESVYG